MRVIATETGFYGCLRFPDEVFDVPDDEEPSTWFTPVDPPAEVKKATKKAASSATSTGDDLA